jgi:hypothetical protein
MDYDGHMLGYWGRNIVKQYGIVPLAFSKDSYNLETSPVVRNQLFQGFFSFTLHLDTSYVHQMEGTQP